MALAGGHASAAGTATERRLFEDGSFLSSGPEGRRFLFEELGRCPEPPDADFPLLAGLRAAVRSRAVATRRPARKRDKGRPADIAPHQGLRRRSTPRTPARPATSARIRWSSSSRSRRGRIEAKAVVTYAVQPGQVFVPIHYGDRQSVDPPVLRPLLTETAVLQGVCGARPPASGLRTHRLHQH